MRNEAMAQQLGDNGRYENRSAYREAQELHLISTNRVYAPAGTGKKAIPRKAVPKKQYRSTASRQAPRRSAESGRESMSARKAGQIRKQRLLRRRRRRMMIAAAEVLVATAAFLAILVLLLGKKSGVMLPVIDQNYQKAVVEVPAEDQVEDGMIQGISAESYAKHPEWTEDFLTPNEYSRPGEPLTEVKNIFVHYTANPNTSAKQNRSYFEQQKDMHKASVSAHFIIGYNGEILQIVPLDEIAYAVQTRNYDSISIECCYKAKNGQFTQETYDSLIKLLAWLTDTYQLSSEDILRHYDCGGKKCPLYYTEHEDAWKILKRDVDKYKEV